MRTIPNDKYQTAAMVRFLNDFGWNWVGIVTTDGDYGRSALDSFVSQASEKGICMAFKVVIPGSVTGQDVTSAIRKAATTIYKNHKANVIVSFIKPTHMRHLLQELRDEAERQGQRTESTRRVWVASDNWSSSSSVQGTLTLQDMGHVVGFTFKRGNLSSFNQYLDRLEATGRDGAGNNTFLEEFYTQLNASSSVSEAVENLREYTHPHTVFNVEMAVSAVAHAVAFLCRSRDCKRPGAVQPWEVLTHTTPT